MISEIEVLKGNITRFLSSAELVYKNNDFTSSTILYFKALFAIIDLITLKKDARIAKDHSERFRILELNHPALYEILHKLYPIYRNTYTATINKEICDGIKENVERIIKEHGIFEDN